MNRRMAWIVAVLVVVAVVIAAAFAFGVVTYEPSYGGERPSGTTIKAPESGPKANPGGR